MARPMPSRRQVGRNSSMPDIVVSRSSIRRSTTGRSPIRHPTTNSRPRAGSDAASPKSSPSSVRQRLGASQTEAALESEFESIENESENPSTRRSSRGARSSRMGVGRRGRTPQPNEERQRSTSRNRSSRRSRSLNARASRLQNSTKPGAPSPAVKSSRKKRASREDSHGSSGSLQTENDGSGEFDSGVQAPVSTKDDEKEKKDGKEKKERSRRGERTKDDSKRSSRTTKSRGSNRSTTSSVKSRESANSSPKSAKGSVSSGSAVGDLSKFLTENSSVSRRKRPSGGARSVGAMSSSRPMTTRRQGRRGSVAGSVSTEKKSDKKERRYNSTSALELSETSEASDIDSVNDESSAVASVANSTRSGREIEKDAASREFDNDTKLQLHISRTDNLLFSVFPRHIAEALRAGRKVEPENHEIVTIFFSDIVGFTDISSNLDPLKISDLLDRLYHSFDALSHYHDVFKVETIGDAYMAVTNLAKPQPDHCKRIAEFAIDAIRVAKQCPVDRDDPSKGFVNIRVGFHSGPVVSNVVGSRNPRYCLFGDTVNTASRMESNSAPNLIHCSDASAELLQEQAPSMKLFPRGGISVKGKGNMKTFWVHEEGPKDEGLSFTATKSLFKTFRGKGKTDS
eukprot:scaffold3373_cov137-Cylindrotheca_fusiformis.AAC.21